MTFIVFIAIMPHDLNMSVLSSIQTIESTFKEQGLAQEILQYLEMESFDADGFSKLLAKSEDLRVLIRTILYMSSQEIAAGNSLAILALEQELSSQAAADLLGVSRQHLVSLMDAGEIAHRKIGKHRRVSLSAVLDFQRESQRRKKLAQQLTKEAQELKMGY